MHEVSKPVTSVTSLIVRHLIRYTTRYTPVTCVTVLMVKDLEQGLKARHGKAQPEGLGTGPNKPHEPCNGRYWTNRIAEKGGSRKERKVAKTPRQTLRAEGPHCSEFRPQAVGNRPAKGPEPCTGAQRGPAQARAGGPAGGGDDDDFGLDRGATAQGEPEP
jgi:hypothetical protein